MRKIAVSVCAIMAAVLSCSSCCVGQFAAINKCIDFNNNLTNNKIVNAVVSYFLLPFEFSIGGFLDILIGNTVEFWNGSNPFAATQTIQGEDGNLYALTPNGNGGYVITCEATQQSLELSFDRQSRTWSAAQNGQEQKLFTMTDENSMVVYAADGEHTVALDEAGLQTCKQLLTGHCYELN